MGLKDPGPGAATGALGGFKADGANIDPSLVRPPAPFVRAAAAVWTCVRAQEHGRGSGRAPQLCSSEFRVLPHHPRVRVRGLFASGAAHVECGRVRL